MPNYTAEQQAAYKAGLAASKKKAPAARKASVRAPKKVSLVPAKKRSGCTARTEYTLRATGEVVQRPCITGWRISKKHGYQQFSAFLGKNNGVPAKESSRERFRNFVVTLVSEQGKSIVNGLYDMKYRKLKLIELGLVANPHSARGGFFGSGGSRLKAKATGTK